MKKCVVCGASVADTKTFCSRKCAMIYSGKTALRVCLVCGEQFTVKMSNVQRGWGKYCSRDCANKAMERKHYLKCPQCGKEFIGDKDNWMKQKFCSRECMKEAFKKPIDKELLERLYVEDELTSRDIAQIVGRDKKVVCDYLKHYGIKTRPDGITNRERIKCIDGHMVRSYYERAFDNLLYRKNIAHEYDVHLPFYKRCMADFVIGDVYVEIWGLMAMKKYREQRERKLALYKEHGCKLLEIFPEDFTRIENKLDELKALMEE